MDMYFEVAPVSVEESIILCICMDEYQVASTSANGT
jgi:hypothetical protein